MCPIIYQIFIDLVVVSDGHTYERGAINKWLNKSDKSSTTNKVLKNNILNSNIALRQMVTTLAESTPPEVETISTEEVINIDIESETILEGHALRHEPIDLSTGYASRNEPNVLSPGHASQQEPIRSDTETVPEGHASQLTPRRLRIPNEILKNRRGNKN